MGRRADSNYQTAVPGVKMIGMDGCPTTRMQRIPIRAIGTLPRDRGWLVSADLLFSPAVPTLQSSNTGLLTSRPDSPGCQPTSSCRVGWLRTAKCRLSTGTFGVGAPKNTAVVYVVQSFSACFQLSTAERQLSLLFDLLANSDSAQVHFRV